MTSEFKVQGRLHRIQIHDGAQTRAEAKTVDSQTRFKTSITELLRWV